MYVSSPTLQLQQGARDRVNVLLLSLAMADLAKLLTTLMIQVRCVFNVLGSVQDEARWRSVTQHQIAQYYRYFNFVSALLTALMALDRALSVSLPLTAHRILSFGYDVIIIIMIMMMFFYGNDAYSFNFDSSAPIL